MGRMGRKRRRNGHKRFSQVPHNLPSKWFLLFALHFPHVLITLHVYSLLRSSYSLPPLVPPSSPINDLSLSSLQQPFRPHDTHSSLQSFFNVHYLFLTLLTNLSILSLHLRPSHPHNLLLTLQYLDLTVHNLSPCYSFTIHDHSSLLDMNLDPSSDFSLPFTTYSSSPFFIATTSISFFGDLTFIEFQESHLFTFHILFFTFPYLITLSFFKFSRFISFFFSPFHLSWPFSLFL